MVAKVTHAFQSAVADNASALAAGEVCPQSHWNAPHTISGLNPDINTSFTSIFANIPLLADYVFGSSAVAGAGQTAITNATQLATYFNNQQSVTGTVKVNGEWEAYQPFSSSANYVFNSGNLQLTGTLTSGQSVAPLASGNTNSFSGSTNSFTTGNLGLSGTTGISVGQVFCQTYIGFYVVTAVTGSGGSATITTSSLLGSSTSLGSYLPFEFLSAYFATTSQATAAGSAVLTFASVPAGVVAGMNVGFYNNTSNTNQASNTVNSSQNYTVLSVTGTTVTLNQNLNGSDAVASGQGIFFWPGINSAQIWTQAEYNAPGQNGATYLAVEATVQFPSGATPYNGAGNISGAAANGAYGNWSAAPWCYGGTTSASSAGADTSEIDGSEIYGSIIRGPTLVDMTPHNGNGTSSLTTFLLNTPAWSGNTYTPGTDFSAAFHKFQFLFTPSMVYWFVDNVMVRATLFNWTSGKNLQFGIDLAIGSWLVGIGTNNLYPVANTNFNGMTLSISELRIFGL